MRESPGLKRGVLRAIAVAALRITAVTVFQPTPACLAESTKQDVFPLSAFEEVVFVPITVGGSERLFVVDSGSTVHVYHTSLRQLLENSKRQHPTRGFFGDVFSADEFQALAMRLGAEDLSTETSVACLDLGSTRAAMGRDIEGILGVPWFTTHIVQLDFDERQMIVLPANAEPNATWGQAFDVRLNRAGLPEIAVQVGDSWSEMCVFDTGSTGTIALRSRVFDQLVKRKAITQRPGTFVATATGIQGTQKGQLSNLQLAKFHHRDLPVIEGGKSSGIGLGYLRRFRVTMDLGRGRLYLSPSAAYDRSGPEPIGLGLVRAGEKTVVLQVVPDSQGARAGVQAQDELLQINGQSVAGKPIAEIRAMMYSALNAAGQFEATLQRNGAALELVVAN